MRFCVSPKLTRHPEGPGTDNRERSVFKPHLRYLSLTAATILFSLTACGPKQTVQPVEIFPDPDSLWIAGYYYHYTYGSPPSQYRGAHVLIREKNDRGVPVPNVSVTIDEWDLSYEPSISAYTGSAGEIISGDSLTLAVRSGEDTVSATTAVPFSPTQLFLRSAIWNVSEPHIGNTLRWTNPAVLGEGIVVYIYSEIDYKHYLLWYGGTEHSESDYLTVYNHEIPYYSDLTSLTALVCQANQTTFTDNPAGSAFTILAGVWGSWQASATP